MWPTTLLILYCGLIVAASLGGGWLPSVMRLTHRRMQVVMSGVAGLMLGVGLFHMLPHSVAETGSIDTSVVWMVGGLLLMFFLIRTFQFHQHDIVGPENGRETKHHGEETQGEHGNGQSDNRTIGQGEDSAAPSVRLSDGPIVSLVHASSHDEGTPHRLSWFGVALGLAVHSLIDGMALAASVQAEANHASYGALLGLGTFLAILLHKPLDALSITSLMLAGGWRVGSRQTVNAGFAMMCPVGAVLFSVSVAQLTGAGHIVVGCALAFSAGVFLCISLGDLLPELQFHAHDRFKLSAALLLGVLAAYGIGFLEPKHAHAPQPPTHEHSGERHESRELRIDD